MIKYLIGGKPPPGDGPFHGRHACISSLFYNPITLKMGRVSITPYQWEEHGALSDEEVKSYLSLLRRSSFFRGKNIIKGRMIRHNISYDLLPHMSPKDNGTLLSLIRYLWESPKIARRALRLYHIERVSADTSLSLCSLISENMGGTGTYSLTHSGGHRFSQPKYGKPIYDLDEFHRVIHEMMEDDGTFRLGKQSEPQFHDRHTGKIKYRTLREGLNPKSLSLQLIMGEFNGKYRNPKAKGKIK